MPRLCDFTYIFLSYPLTSSFETRSGISILLVETGTKYLYIETITNTISFFTITMNKAAIRKTREYLRPGGDSENKFHSPFPTDLRIIPVFPVFALLVFASI